MEEETHLEQSAMRVHVLVVDHAADRRLVHADVVGDVLEHERAELLDPVVEKAALELDDRVATL